MPISAAKRAVRNQGRQVKWLAERIGVSRSHLSRQLDGSRPFSAEQAQRVAEITGLPVEMFRRNGEHTEVA